MVQLCGAMAFGFPLFGNSPTVCFGISFDSITRNPSFSVIRTRFDVSGFLLAGTSTRAAALVLDAFAYGEVPAQRERMRTWLRQEPEQPQ